MKPNPKKSAALRVREARTTPFLWISKTLLKNYKLSWRAILAYTAVAYYARTDSATCKDVGIKVFAETVGVSEDTMKRGLAELVQKKAIRLKQRFKKQKGKLPEQLPNEYTLIDLKGDMPL